MLIDMVYLSDGDYSKCSGISQREYLLTWGNLQEAVRKYPDLAYREAYNTYIADSDTRKNNHLPPVHKQVKTFVKSLGEIALSGFKRVEQKEYERRLEICFGCKYMLLESNRCVKCGCFMKAKALSAIMRCSIGKW